jgi:hypothetical protein
VDEEEDGGAVNTQQIRTACHKALANPAFEMDMDGTTFCNMALYAVCKELGLPLPEGKTANELCDWLVTNRPRVSSAEAHALAWRGEAVVATYRATGPGEHGHVALVYPFPTMVMSGKWGTTVPICANIGKDNGVMGVNYAFAVLPEYFLLSTPSTPTNP